MRWFRKPTVEFLYTIPGIEYMAPVIPASEYKHQWVRKMAAKFAEAKKQPDFGLSPHVTTAKCPGIASLLSTGYIVRTWQDITIKTNGDGSSVEWESMINQRDMSLERSEAIAFHMEDQLSGFMENWPKDYLRTIVKFGMPIRIKVKKGYTALMMPVAYADEDRFEACAGVIDSDFPYAPLNVNVKWRVLNGKTLIKAGTPLAQIVIFKNEKTTYKINQANPRHIQLYELLSCNRFVSNYKAIKSLLTKAIQ